MKFSKPILIATLVLFCSSLHAQQMSEKEYNDWKAWWEHVKTYRYPDEIDSTLWGIFTDCDTMTRKARFDLKKHQYRYLVPSQFGLNPRTVVWCWILANQYKITPVIWPISCLRADEDVETSKCYNRVIENYFYYRYGQKMEDVELEKVDSVLNNTRRDTLKKWFPAGLNGQY
jgi:hypothetical protein